jgi:hypothetical protein
VDNCTSFMEFPCRAGYYGSYLEGICKICEVGCYCPGINAEIIACDHAAVNFSSPVGATSVLQCVPSGSQPTWPAVCPDNTQPGSGVLELQSLLQCRANAGHYYVPGTLAAGTQCPPSFYCPVGSVVPLPCPFPPTICPQMGQYPTPLSLCPLAGTAQPAPACQTCVGLPSNAFWTSNSDPSCPACCVVNHYRYTASACNLQPDSSVCGAGEYMPTPLPCAMSVQSCTTCPAPSSPGFDHVNASVRSAVQGYGIASGCSQTACAAGFRMVNGTSCSPCAPGTFKAWVGNDTACVACGEGQVAGSAGSTQCTRCPVYSHAWQKVECRCMAGFYLSSFSSCVACEPGYVTTNGTQTACTQCTAGTKWTLP